MKDNVNQNKRNANEIEYTPERARLPTTKNIELHSDNGNYVPLALERLSDTLKKLRDDRGWTNSTMLEHLDVNYYHRPEQFGRIINNEESKRSPSAGQMFELRRVFGISLDAIADGDDPFEIEQMSDARLVELMELFSAELARRIRQR